tara:strand:- start:175 stop:1140 length:966 start_codon:yes stop_codon:yes gene_type:complete
MRHLSSPYTQSLESVIRDTLHRASVSIINEVGSEFTAYCPFHDNKNTPSFSINKENGLWHCFNPDCDKQGSIRGLRKMLLNEETRFSKTEISDEFLKAILEDSDKEDTEISEDVLDACLIDYDSDDVNYLKPLVDRGFELDTLRYFEVGYSRNKERITIPVRDQSYSFCGIIGRATDESQVPRYLYSTGFTKSRVLFNLNNAKAHSEVIVVEGSLDAIKIHQAGFPNVVATLGAAVTEDQMMLLSKNFDSIIIIPDNDSAGYAMADDIISSNRGMEIHVGVVDPDFKDAGDLNSDQIKQTINNKINVFNEYEIIGELYEKL